MGFGTGFAVYFIIWWVVLFVVLPFGIRTQQEEGEVTPGTVASAPASFRFWTVVARTTIVSALVFGAYLVATEVYGYSIDDVMRILPDFTPRS